MPTLIESLRSLFARDLAALGREVEAYPDDAAPWQPVPGVSNTGGTLVLHICGNLRHYVGGVLGHTSYVRDRPAEFATRDIPRSELRALVEHARTEVMTAIAGISSAMLERTFPEPVGGVTLQTGDFLLHLLSHLDYHLGQVDSHRRAATGLSTGVGAMNLKELASARGWDEEKG